MNTNQEHLEAMRNGDLEYIKNFYQNVFPSIRHLIVSSNGTEEDAKDIFQEAILFMYYKSQNPGFILTSKLSTYFYGVCKNLWGNRIQKKDFKIVTIDPAIKFNSEETFETIDPQVEKRLLYDRAFAKLDLPCKRLLNLFFEKIPMKQIASKMGFISEGYARRRKHQCKERLVELVKKEPGYTELCEEDD